MPEALFYYLCLIATASNEWSHGCVFFFFSLLEASFVMSLWAFAQIIEYKVMFMAKKAKTGKVRFTWLGWAVVILILGLIGSCMGDEEEPTPAEQPEEPSIVVEESSEEEAPEMDEPVEVEPPVQEEPVQEAPAEEPAPTVDPEQAFRESLKQYTYVGSSESDKAHVPTCRWTSEINDTNLVHFDSEEEAEAAGYSACGSCKPF